MTLKAPVAPAAPRTSAALAKRLGVTVRAVNKWRRAGLPEPGKDGWDIEAVIAWRDSNLLPARGPGRPPGPRGAEAVAPRANGATDRERLIKAQADQREALAQLAALQLAIERGEYLPRSEMESRDLARIAAVKRGLLALPKSVAHLIVGLSPQEAEQMLTTKVRDLLTKFSSM